MTTRKAAPAKAAATKTTAAAAAAATGAPPNRIDDLRAALAELCLHDMRAQLEAELAAAARDGDTRIEFLWRLVEAQIRRRRERAVERRIEEAGLKVVRTIEEFDFGFQPKLDRDRIFELGTLEFIKRGENVLFGGASGTGKSHLAIALAHLACRAGYRTLYVTSATLLTKLHASLATGTLAKALKAFTKPDLLVIDELGLDAPEREEARDAQLLYKAIAARYSEPRSTLITTNIPWESWGTYLRDDLATVAIVDRLIHHGHLITIDGPSYRAHEHARLNKKRPVTAARVGP